MSLSPAGITPEFEKLLHLFDHLRDRVSQQHVLEIDALLAETRQLRSQIAEKKPRCETSLENSKLRTVSFAERPPSTPLTGDQGIASTSCRRVFPEYGRVAMDRNEDEQAIPVEDINLELLQPHYHSLMDDSFQKSAAKVDACRLDLPHRRTAEVRVECNADCKGCDSARLLKCSSTDIVQNGASTISSKSDHLNGTINGTDSHEGQLWTSGSGEQLWLGSASAKSTFGELGDVRSRSNASCLTMPGQATQYQMLDFWKQHSDLSRFRVSEVLRDWCGATSPMLSSPSNHNQRKALMKRFSYSSHNVGGAMSGTKWRDMADAPECHFALNPYSKVRLVWVFVSLLLLAIDAIMVPLTTCFDIPFTAELVFYNLLECVFWTVDIVFSFFTGVFIDGALHMELSVIACNYLKGWFCFDVIIVGLDWLMVVLEGIDDASPFRYLRNFRWMRTLRVLRVLRFARLFKLKMFVSEFIVLSSEGLNVTVFYFKATVLVLLGGHVSACLWHLLGSSLENGWVQASDYDQKEVFDRYVLSLRWVAGHLQGTSAGERMKTATTVEIALDVAMLILSLIVVSFYIGIATHAIIINRNSDASKTKTDALQFARRHEIQRAVYHRMLKFLSAHRVTGPGELLRAESRLLSIFPRALQEDLLFETRTRLLCASSFLDQIHQTIPRVVRHLCFEAIEDVLAVESDVVFAANDVCARMLFVRSGEFKYNLYRNRPSGASGSSASTKTSKTSRRPRLVKGDCLSEACLWVHWFHCGDLVAQRDCLLLALSSSKFANVISQQRSACVFAVKYARAFARELNLDPQTDLARVDIAFHDLDDVEFSGTSEDHLFFISHYKQEAGTEAALMRDALEILIQTEATCDFQSPVFIDSEDLVDLARLRFHVEGSKALLLLLTPGVLFRPWCLLEVCTAHQHGVQILPVEVQRPGMKYEYPDDDFYRRLHRREVLDREGHQLLESQGVTLDMLDEAIRHVFLKIALPFSPHKSGNVRHAELLDIVRRSNTNMSIGRASRIVRTSEVAFGARLSSSRH